MMDEIKKWKTHALSTQNYLILKKYISPVVFAVSPASKFCFERTDGWKDGQMMSNTIVANRLLTAETTDNQQFKKTKMYYFMICHIPSIPNLIKAITM